MQNDKRLETIIDCLQYAVEGKIGKNIKRNDTMTYIVEIYPYNDGMFLLYTIKDSRCLIFDERKLLVQISEDGNISILGECDLHGTQSIDTCITEEFIDAREIFIDMYNNTNSIFFKKKHIEKLNEKIKMCKKIAQNTIGRCK